MLHLSHHVLQLRVDLAAQLAAAAQPGGAASPLSSPTAVAAQPASPSAAAASPAASAAPVEAEARKLLHEAPPLPRSR